MMQDVLYLQTALVAMPTVINDLAAAALQDGEAIEVRGRITSAVESNARHPHPRGMTGVLLLLLEIAVLLSPLPETTALLSLQGTAVPLHPQVRHLQKTEQLS